ncbi:hypothetical protein HPB51_016729 [Rhipicephalus microplus]|uniref:RING-type domain-containing protein n=1 Tax=Rhipicephalus microplus TaxID=6941 RepID=A0A9J6DAN8_RHIMP|nr:uncharacterized protein LOC119176849 [Rhipicephalus microplus]KAH8019091.1 hypothetical protein HPB51_016729 [Rhipicephalus microplus]
MEGYRYTLTGFGEFLELRSVSFAQPMAAIRVCVICGLVPSRIQVLRCGHGLCDHCYSHIESFDRCPADGAKLEARTSVEPLIFKLSDLEQRRVYCAAASDANSGCGFAGTLYELRNHLTQCGGGKVRCYKCHRPIARDSLRDQMRTCPGETEVRAAVGSHSCSTEPTDVRSLPERVASLERELRKVRQELQDLGDPTDSKKRKSAPTILGPFCAASAAGVLITTCKFSDVDAAYDSLNRDNKTRRIASDTYMLGGYTFRLDCEFSKKRPTAGYVRFIFHLRDGEWDSYVEWPFSKKVTLIVMHLRDAAKSIRLPLNPKSKCNMVQRPRSDSWNWGQWTTAIKWETIKLQGFVDKGALYLNVEFE